MSWILPDISDLPAGGKVRTALGEFDRTAYARAYYHAKRKQRRKPQVRTPEQKALRRQQARQRYYRNVERARADARARYWKHRDKYAAAARERAKTRRAA